MCLFLEAISPSGDRASLQAAAIIASSVGLRVDVGHASSSPWAKSQPVRATISEDGGCACSLLSDEADWNTETWTTRPDVLDRLAATLEILASHGPTDLVVQALWVGDTPKTTMSVTPRELADVARSNRLGTRTRYSIVAAKAR